MRRKSLTMILLSAVLLFNLSAVAVAAEDKQFPEMGCLEFWEDYYSYENQQEVQQLNNKVENFVQSKKLLRSGMAKNLSVPIHKQETTYSCGAASVRMVLEYKTGTDYGETSLASDMGTQEGIGTHIDNIVSKLNTELGSGSYKKVSTSDISFGSGIMYSIEKDRPIICHIRTGTPLPNYSSAGSSGHYIVAKGYYFNAQAGEGSSTVTYHDPHYNDSHYGTYTTSIEIMVQALNNRYGLYVMSE